AVLDVVLDGVREDAVVDEPPNRVLQQPLLVRELEVHAGLVYGRLARRSAHHRCGVDGDDAAARRRSTPTLRACSRSGRDTRRLNAEQQTLNRLGPIKRNAMSRRHVVALGAVALACAFASVGFVGVDRYARNYWLYRGFPPPHDPAYVTQAGTQEHIKVQSAALGGRSQDVYVYLPPGYSDNPTRRYPVVYLLHGFPGRPLAFLLTVRMGVVEDELVA